MIMETVKVDSKGRITIPASIRLLLDINDGDTILLSIDEDNYRIELKIFKNNTLYLCKGQLDRQTLLEMLEKLKVVSLKCRCIDDECQQYRCESYIDTTQRNNLDIDGMNCFSVSGG
ncbi:transcriptional regulator, AbrB family [Ignisphaera aggregans DSM 17230]|uniref:Transcriptional regulator, AbrB family n=1 Tax=Ignisphaera aggregans (strain DSM 17230 / JCM 13409 / AQ1.S1) TaxID=583356 RepID=E0SPX8_IGNAA|nr:transcriptional regulator, AbrB family [Ignisphaera aggregans DSM 17230]